MSHLDIERLAMLADDEPSEAERVHLIECEPCNTEWRAYRALRGVAAQAPSEMNMDRLTTWDALAAQLREEGLIREGARGPSAGTVRMWMRVAAAVLIAAAGVAVGRATAMSDAAPGSQIASGVDESGFGTLTSVTPDTAFGSVEEARAALARAEEQYRMASLWLLERQEDVSADADPDTYRMRLAALDEVAGAAREAVYEAPHDPVINSYYLNTLAAREVTLKQLNASLTDGQVRRF